MSRLVIARVHERDEQLELVMGFSDGALINMELPKSDTVGESHAVLEAFAETLRSCIEKQAESLVNRETLQ